MFFEVKDHKIVKSAEYSDYMFSLPDWIYQIKKYIKTRTNEQNKYLWWWVYTTIAKEIWEDTEYVHWVMWMKFLIDNSKKSPYVKSTAKLNKDEFSEYVENIKNFVSWFWIKIPSADEYNKFLDNNDDEDE